MPQITKQMLIGDILDLDESTSKFFFSMGMHCLGCPAAQGESLEQACATHNVNADEMVKKLNEHLKQHA